jgi:hypothetical protein
MKRVDITLECLCPDAMDPDVFGEMMLCRIENARGIETSINGQLMLAPTLEVLVRLSSVAAVMDQTVVDE